jgi:hypothetical protein
LAANALGGLSSHRAFTDAEITIGGESCNCFLRVVTCTRFLTLDARFGQKDARVAEGVAVWPHSVGHAGVHRTVAVAAWERVIVR